MAELQYGFMCTERSLGEELCCVQPDITRFAGGDIVRRYIASILLAQTSRWLLKCGLLQFIFGSVWLSSVAIIFAIRIRSKLSHLVRSSANGFEVGKSTFFQFSREQAVYLSTDKLPGYSVSLLRSIFCRRGYSLQKRTRTIDAICLVVGRNVRVYRLMGICGVRCGYEMFAKQVGSVNCELLVDWYALQLPY